MPAVMKVVVIRCLFHAMRDEMIMKLSGASGDCTEQDRLKVIGCLWQLHEAVKFLDAFGGRVTPDDHEMVGCLWRLRAARQP